MTEFAICNRPIGLQQIMEANSLGWRVDVNSSMLTRARYIDITIDWHMRDIRHILHAQYSQYLRIQNDHKNINPKTNTWPAIRIRIRLHSNGEPDECEYVNLWILLYADAIILISVSPEELQRYLMALKSFCISKGFMVNLDGV